MVARRRIVLLGITLLAGGIAFAQRSGSLARIGFLPLGSSDNEYDRSQVDAFRQGLRQAGLVENRDFALDLVWVDNDAGYAAATRDLVSRGATLLVPAGTSAAVAARAQTSSIPIVFITVGDPVGVKLVDNLSRPGGNATGFSDVLLDLSGKYVELAKEIGSPVPIVHYLWYTAWANGQNRYAATTRAAEQSNVKLRDRGIANAGELDPALASMKGDGASVAIVQPSPFTYRNRGRIIDTAAARGVATIFAWPTAAREGALVAYGPDYAELYRRAAGYVTRILVRGVRAGDLPVEQPTKFELVVNVRAGRMLNLAVPQSVLLHADEVIV